MNPLLENPTIRGACAALAPEDELDLALGAGEKLSEQARNVLLGRKLGCVRASLKVVATLAAAIDHELGEGDGTKTRDEAEGYLSEVAAWAAEPSKKTTEAVEAALDKSSLMRLVPAVDGGTRRQPDYSASKIRKACYHTIMCCLAPTPSDAAGHLANVALTSAGAIEVIAQKEGGWAHPRLVGMIQGEGL